MSIAGRSSGPDHALTRLGYRVSRRIDLPGYLQMAEDDAGSSNIAPDAGDDIAAVGKIDVARDGTPSSMESTPEVEGATEASQEPAAQPQKRKGGRKPVGLCFQVFNLALRD